MTPIDWNDSEPTSPDFLPPLPKQERRFISEKEACERISGVLQAAGIKISLIASEYTCCCCSGSSADMDVEFPDGAHCWSSEFRIEAKGYTQR